MMKLPLTVWLDPAVNRIVFPPALQARFWKLVFPETVETWASFEKETVPPAPGRNEAAPALLQSPSTTMEFPAASRVPLLKSTRSLTVMFPESAVVVPGPVFLSP